MNGVLVGKRLIGTQAPVTVGWENIPRVEGGPVKQFIFTWFQPTMLFALIAFWYYAPNSIAKTSTAVGVGIGFRVLLLALEWVNPRYESWRLTWKELVTDLFYVGLGYTVLGMAEYYIGSDAVIEAVQHNFDWSKLAWFTGLPLLVQAFLISFIFDFGQYWMHRGMHNWYPAAVLPLWGFCVPLSRLEGRRRSDARRLSAHQQQQAHVEHHLLSKNIS